MNPEPLYPVPNYPVPLYSVPFTKRLGKRLAPFAVCSIPSETDSDSIPVELYSPAPTIVTAVVKGEGFRRLDVDQVALNGAVSPMFLLGRGTCEVGSDGRAAWLSLYIPALARGTDPAKLEFGTFSVSSAE